VRLPACSPKAAVGGALVCRLGEPHDCPTTDLQEIAHGKLTNEAKRSVKTKGVSYCKAKRLLMEVELVPSQEWGITEWYTVRNPAAPEVPDGWNPPQ